MAATTSIEWAANADGSPGATWNPIRARDTVTGKVGTFCVHASDGCKHCYAEKLQQRGLPANGIGLAYTAPNLARVEHYLDERMLAAPLRRRKPTTYFLSSMTDVFGEWVPDAMLDLLFAAMGLCPQHRFIVLTKRAERMREYLTTPNRKRTIAERVMDLSNLMALIAQSHTARPTLDHFSACFKPPGPLPNICLGVSVEDQRNADERIPHLLATPARWRAVSCEPLLGAIDYTRMWLPMPNGGKSLTNVLRSGCDGTHKHHGDPTGHDHGPGTSWHVGDPRFQHHHHDEGCTAPRIDWVICGGESGPNARPMHPDWARSLRDQCADAGVPYFMKQWGEWAEANPGPDHTLEMVETGGPNRTPKPGAYGSPLEKGDALVALDGHTVFDFDAMRDDVKYRRMLRLGKARAGRLLDGVEHNARPDFWSTAEQGEARLLATTASPGRRA